MPQPSECGNNDGGRDSAASGDFGSGTEAVRRGGLAAWARRLFGSATAAVLSAGALASAIAAIVGLVTLLGHHHDRHPAVAWRAVTLTAQDQTLGEFAARVQRQGSLFGAAGGREPVPVAGAGGHAVRYDLAATHTVTVPSPSPRRSRRALRRLRGVRGRYARRVVVAVNRRVHTSEPCARRPNSVACGLRSLLPAASHDEEGNLVPSIVSARRLVRFLRSVRTPAHRHTPLGAYVNVELRLRDLAGERVLATFSVVRTDGGIEVPARWAREFVVFDLTPKSDDQRETTVLWVPEPRTRGRYLVQLFVLRRAGSVGSQNSGVFH
jgi:hypothetical protein